MRPAAIEPAAHADARAILDQHGLGVHAIVLVEPDCVLYVNKQLKPVTAWMTVTKANTNTGYVVNLALEHGFVAERGTPTEIQRPNPAAPFSLKRNTQF